MRETEESPREDAIAERTLEEIQAEIATAADRLEGWADELKLEPLMAAIERDYFPKDEAEMELIATGEVSPPVAFEVHGDLADAVKDLGEAIQGLRRAATWNTETVLAAWRERLLARTSDPAMRQALRELWR